jgi:hypothetical protein
MSTIDFKFKKFNGRVEYLPAKAVMDDIVNSTDFQTGDAFSTVWSQSFIIWLGNEVSIIVSLHVFDLLDSHNVVDY